MQHGGTILNIVTEERTRLARRELRAREQKRVAMKTLKKGHISTFIRTLTTAL